MRKPSILVVEDNPLVLETIRNMLDKSEYSIGGIATSGEDAIEAARKYQPDLALMDVTLTGKMDGIEAARLIASQFHIPVVYLTAASDSHTVSAAVLAGAYGYIHKPFSARELFSTLQIALHKHEMERTLKENGRWLEALLQCISEAVIATDSIGCIKLINPAASAMTGWTREEAVGRDILDVFRVLDCDTREPAECGVVMVIRDCAPSPNGRTKILVARDGSESTVEEIASPITDDSGGIVGVVLVVRK
jgi:PAS domain S-box-containing protein